MTDPIRLTRLEHHPEVLGTPREGDMSRLTDMLSRAFDSIRPSLVEEYIPRVISADAADVLVSRNELGRIASVMIVNIDFGAAKLRGRIDDVTTHPDSRREGHAALLLDFALGWFQERGVRRINLTSGDDKKPAHGLYLSRGFKIRQTNQFQLDLE